MRSYRTWLILVVVIVVGLLWNRHGGPLGPSAGPRTQTTASRPTPNQAAPAPGLPSFLPPEARDTLALIARGGPFPNRQDGVVFGNREGLLPPQPRGYYHEYTVATPGLDYRGARRIITGGNPPVVYYYTDDHYRSFRAFEVPR